MDHTFGKDEKLCSKKIIEQLFNEGKSFLAYPLKVVFLPVKLPGNMPVQVAFSVGKKLFKHAVDRNLIKRRMREAYRQNKDLLFAELDTQIALFYIQIGKEIPDFQTLEKSVLKSFKKIKKEFVSGHDTSSGNTPPATR